MGSFMCISMNSRAFVTELKLKALFSPIARPSHVGPFAVHVMKASSFWRVMTYRSRAICWSGLIPGLDLILVLAPQRLLFIFTTVPIFFLLRRIGASLFVFGVFPK